MAQTRRVSAVSARREMNRTAFERNAYVYGSAVPKQDIRRVLEEEPRKKLSHETRKNREKAHHMSFGYVVFLMAALCAAGIVLINYLQMQADLTNRIKHVTKLENQLIALQNANDEEYNRIESSVDLEEIKRIAIGELGMTYAKEGQIINYESVGMDYMRKVAQE